MKPTTQAISNNDNDKRAKRAGKTLQGPLFVSLSLSGSISSQQQQQQIA